MYEPGIDRHEWETEWQALEPLVIDSPAEALPEVNELLERMLVGRGLLTEDRVAAEGADPGILAEYVAGVEVVRRLEAGENVDPGDLGSAITGYRSLYEYLLEDRSAPS